VGETEPKGNLDLHRCCCHMADMKSLHGVTVATSPCNTSGEQYRPLQHPRCRPRYFWMSFYLLADCLTCQAVLLCFVQIYIFPSLRLRLPTSNSHSCVWKFVWAWRMFTVKRMATEHFLVANERTIPPSTHANMIASCKSRVLIGLRHEPEAMHAP